MPSDILYERTTAHGPSVRIRLTSESGASPVTAVLEVDRRAGTPRGGVGALPTLARTEADSTDAALAVLEPKAREDRAVAILMHEQGLR